ncbi:DUF2971 domain-containing protein [Yokenella regensburgei]|uniref:DUF2971 domain-containing protein n=1 Tax=Yokenella regensburgei TaxID=158877 RepID=UPI003EDA0259
MYLSSDTHIFRFRADNEYTVKELTENTIWHSKIGELNDPFEMFFNFDMDAVQKLSHGDLALIIKDSTFLKENRSFIELCFVQKKLAAVHRFLNANLGKSTAMSLLETIQSGTVVACFTKKHDSRLMWGYYGNGMKGVCFAYNKSKLIASGIELGDVEYVTSAPSINIYKHMVEMMRGIPCSIDSKFVLAKHSDWIQEDEVRSVRFIDNEHFSKEASGYAVQLDSGCIDAVIIGSRLTGVIRDSIEDFARKNGIKLFEAKADFNSYKIHISEEK